MDKIGKFNFCKGCIFILQNCKPISDNPELEKTIQSYINLKKEFDENVENCNFCFGILSPSIENKIMTKIKEINQIYDFVDYKLTTNFSPLFHLVHNYVSYNSIIQ